MLQLSALTVSEPLRERQNRAEIIDKKYSKKWAYSELARDFRNGTPRMAAFFLRCIPVGSLHNT